MCIRTSLGSTWTSWWRRRRAATTGAPCLDSSPKHTMDTMAGADETPWTLWTPWTHPPSTSWAPWQEQMRQRQAVLTLVMWSIRSQEHEQSHFLKTLHIRQQGNQPAGRTFHILGCIKVEIYLCYLTNIFEQAILNNSEFATRTNQICHQNQSEKTDWWYGLR